MRITVVNLYYPPDGSPTGRLAAALAAHRAGRGDEVTVVTSSARYQASVDAREGDDPRVTVHRVRGPRRPPRRIAGRVRQYLGFYCRAGWRMARLPRQDVVVCMTTPPLAAWLGVLHRWRRRGGARVVQWTMDCYPEILEVAGLVRPGGLAARACRWLNRRLFARLDHVVCLDEAMWALLRSQYGGDGAPPMSVVPNWEPRGRLAPGAVGPWAGARDLGTRLVILYLGNAGWGHEIDTVLAAARELRDDPVAFVFVGGGLHYPRLRAAGLPNVHVHDYVPEETLPQVLAAADLGLIALAEGAAGVMSPSKLHGYLAAGLPVLYVGPPASNVDQAVREFDCGARFDPADACGLAEYVRALEPDRLAALGRNARRAFETAYCDDAALPRLDQVLDGLAVRPSGAGPERLAA